MTQKHDTAEEPGADFPIIALCASAGGLEAYQAFFDVMPANTGMAFVVVQHLAIVQESILHDLIQRQQFLCQFDGGSDCLLASSQQAICLPGSD